MKKITVICLALLATFLGTSCVETYPSRGYAYRTYDRHHRSDSWDRHYGPQYHRDWDRDGRRQNVRYNDHDRRFGGTHRVNTISYYR